MKARTLGAIAVLLTPVVITVADLLRLGAEGGVLADGSASTTQLFTAVNAHRGAWEAGAWLFYLAALLTIPMVLLLWRLAVDRAPVLAWTGGVLGAGMVTGQIAHLMGYFVTVGALSGMPDTEAAVSAQQSLDASSLGFAVFAPFLLGVLLAPAVLALALWRARVIPGWALGSVLLGTVVFAAFSGQPWASVVWGVALVAGLLPAARSALRSVDTDAPRVADRSATSAAPVAPPAR
ncbi:hypothetical protein MWU75_01105 [Ornithinimicrobium sp. F0845]|uniref:hypothetical protein n=1 Tax=Ornithinimicrobium sp. F0845 TaxID=2926412 RepID=UPI001FF3813E|nr:hypothetical protein [Ornithinimicrobium sp. F0845]MCK0110740.1 hypothetical protein [Ornithinimicrobium sp. F0845]